MTKLEELTAAAVAAYAVVADAHKAIYAAEVAAEYAEVAWDAAWDAYYAELKKIQEEQTND
jgi:hypothetical protein